MSNQEPVSDARVVVADEKLGVDLEWTVGGAFEVGTTQVRGPSLRRPHMR